MAEAAQEPRFSTAPLAGGPRLHYAERGAPRGEAILLLHGWPDSWFSYSRVIPLLPAEYRVLALDQRGYGESEQPDGRCSIDDLAEDAVAFLDAVGIDRATLVGHSFGTFVARRAAETDPERVSRLVLIGSAASPANDVLREVQEAVRDLADPVPPEFAREFQAGTVHLPVPDEFFEGIVRESLKLPARLWREMLDALLAFDDAADLGRIVAPTLLIWGEHDALFPREEQARLLSAIPDARLTVYPDAGHCPNWEQPEQVAADIAAFIREAQRPG
jgi:non-heme chloroperoxidase